MQTIRITTSQNIDIDYEIAGVGARVLARLIDLAIFFVVLIFSIMFCRVISRDYYVMLGIIGTIWAVLFVFYDLLCEIFMNGQSIGKKIIKIKIISLDGSRPSVGQYFMRWLFRIVDFGLIEPGVIALIVAAISEKPQRIGDIVAGTILVRTESRTKMEHVAFVNQQQSYQPVFTAASQLNDQDIELIHEVIQTYYKTQNSVVLYNMAARIKSHLGISSFMDDMQFLQTITKDYNHLTSLEAI